MASGVDPAALRAARERAGLTQHELARLVGVAGGERISRWELGASEPRPASVVRLAEILQVPVLGLVHLVGSVPDLRALRLKAGLSAAEVATRARLSKPTYVRWEAGQWLRLPDEATLASLARALGEPVGVVIAGLREAQRLRGASD